ncbi:hypothetical protein BLNAU_2228 [Blattamonas nauphoetae]|uniref:Uncharacterized protein n=1 Tax=Blattamonas nauphoetae TaxID=2049346 RepID=A0ABQ9YG93_9EUKA|nr:hypothetical protein BLNAU_2228 [Blattamonas nauphoetae]
MPKVKLEQGHIPTKEILIQQKGLLFYTQLTDLLNLRFVQHSGDTDAEKARWFIQRTNLVQSLKQLQGESISRGLGNRLLRDEEEEQIVEKALAAYKTDKPWKLKDLRQTIQDDFGTSVFIAAANVAATGLSEHSTTDVTGKKKVGVLARILGPETNPETNYLMLEEKIGPSTSTGYLQLLEEIAEKTNLPMNCVTSVATDGEATTTGSETGLWIQLSNNYERKLTQNCAAYRTQFVLQL